MITWLLNRIFRGIDMADVPGLPAKAKMLALKDAYLVDDFQTYKKRRMAATMKTLALKADHKDEVMFYRGLLYCDQMDLQNMQKAHQQYVKEGGNPIMARLKNEFK